MLLGAFLIISVLAAVLICFGGGAFATAGWLWVLPVSFVGVFVGLLIVCFVVVVIMSAFVDMGKSHEKDAPLYRWVIHEAAKLIMPLLRARLHTSGLEKTPAEGRFLLVCNHLFDIDPVMLMLAFPKSTLAFISKRENDKKFIIGPFLRKIMCQPINRENDREALKTILKCIDLIKEDKASIGVFPEGYVSLDRLLHPFRNGVFKIALRTNVPVVVCTLRNTHMVLKNAMKGKPTDIYLNLVDVIPAESLQGMSAVELGNKVHAMMAQDLGPDLVLQA